MMHLQTILHPTDFSAGAGAALAYALDLADRFGAALHLLHVVPAVGSQEFRELSPAVDGPDADLADWKQKGAETLRALEARRSGRAVRIITAHGPQTGAAIVEYAHRSGADLLVMGARGDGSAASGCLGSVSREIVHRAPCPVLTVGDGHAAEGAGPIRHVAAAVDPKHPAVAELRTARDLSARLGAHLTLLHVVSQAEHPVLAQVGAASVAYLRRALSEDARRYMQEEYRRAESSAPGDGPALPADVAYTVLLGSPGDEMVRFAVEAGVDLLVLSLWKPLSAQHGAWADLVEFVVSHAPCPVLTLNQLGTAGVYPPGPPPARQRTPAERQDGLAVSPGR